MICTIISPQKTANYKNVTSIILPAASGQVQVLSGHAEAFFLLNEGELFLEIGEKGLKAITIEAAECYVKNDQVKIIL